VSGRDDDGDTEEENVGSEGAVGKETAAAPRAGHNRHIDAGLGTGNNATVQE
jgi:hypothetical protein